MAPLRTCVPSVKLDVGRKQGWGTERGVPRRDYGGVAGAENSHTPHLKTAQHRLCSPTAAAWQAPHGRSFPKQLAGVVWRDGRERKERSRGLDLLFPVKVAGHFTEAEIYRMAIRTAFNRCSAGKPGRAMCRQIHDS